MGVPGAGSGEFPSEAGVGLLTALLPRQGKGYVMPYSLEVDQQLRQVLATGLDLGVGRGVVAGATVTDNGGLSVLFESTGTALFVGGLAWVLAADLPFNGLSDGVTNWVWGSIEVARRNQGNRTSLDTYTLKLQATVTSAVPDADHDWFLLVKVPTSGGAVTVAGIEYPLTRYTLLGQHQHNPTLDHPDGSVTDAKLASSPWARVFMMMGG